MKLTPDVISRIKEVNKESGLSKRQFSLLLGHSASAIHEIYAGRVKVLSQSNISILELKFGINPHWLETGEGPKKNAGQYLDNAEELALIELLRLLPPEKRRMVQTLTNALVFEHQAQSK